MPEKPRHRRTKQTLGLHALLTWTLCKADPSNPSHLRTILLHLTVLEGSDGGVIAHEVFGQQPACSL
eukprot:5207534-Amphidinium_carterae.1